MWIADPLLVILGGTLMPQYCPRTGPVESSPSYTTTSVELS